MNRNKSLVFSSSLLLLAMGFAACSGTPVNLGNGRDGVEPLMPTPDNDDSGAGMDPSCVYEENTYADGQTFPAVDGCNTCTCDDGAVACTERACNVMPEGGCNYAGAVYANGTIFPSEDGLDTCWCVAEMVTCTNSGGGDCELGGVLYNNGERIPSTDCNSMWCQDGMIASTLVECPVPGDCTYGDQTYEVGESFSYAGGLTVCTCEMDGLHCVTEDMCNASVRLCEEAGGNAMECAIRYAGCMPQTPTAAECDATLAACKEQGMSMNGMQVDCEQQFASCLDQVQEQPMTANMCDVAQVSCLEADPTDANGDCSEAYMRCAGNIDPTNPAALCGQTLDACRMNGGMQCVPEYIACVNESGVVQPNPGTCELDGIVYPDGAEVPSSDCNTQYCRSGVIVTTMVQCQDGGAAN
jgi:Pacifastin inhibitor (LCMII)